jgi:hypothetical protein
MKKILFATLILFFCCSKRNATGDTGIKPWTMLQVFDSLGLSYSTEYTYVDYFQDTIIGHFNVASDTVVTETYDGNTARFACSFTSNNNPDSLVATFSRTGTTIPQNANGKLAALLKGGAMFQIFNYQSHLTIQGLTSTALPTKIYLIEGH